MAVQTSAGSKIYIGTTSSDEENDSYVEVGEVTNIPEFGRAYEEVTFASLGNRAVQKFKGTYNDGTITVQLGRDVSDVGQAARSYRSSRWERVESAGRLLRSARPSPLWLLRRRSLLAEYLL